jgi:hypothetical protein
MPTHGEFNTEAKRIEEMIDAGARFQFNGQEVDNWQDLETRIVNRSESDQEQFREAIRTTYNNMSQRAGRFTWIPSDEKRAPTIDIRERPNGRFGVGARWDRDMTDSGRDRDWKPY